MATGPAGAAYGNLFEALTYADGFHTIPPFPFWAGALPSISGEVT